MQNKKSEVYENVFDPISYRKRFVSLSDDGDESMQKIFLWQLAQFHDFYSSNFIKNARILEYGGGPCSIYPLISAVPFASEIIFAEYAEQNRRQTEMWKEGSGEGADFTTLFQHVLANLEGSDRNSVENAKKREDKLRSLISAIVPCDITEKMAVDPEVQVPFDIVSTHYCLICACQTIEDYKSGLRKLAKLLRPGGRIVMTEAVRSSFYIVGEEKISTLSLDSRDLVTSCVQQAGFSQVSVNVLEAPPSELTACTECLFINAVVDQ